MLKSNVSPALWATINAKPMTLFLAMNFGKKQRVICRTTGNVVQLRRFRGKIYFDRAITYNSDNTTRFRVSI